MSFGTLLTFSTACATIWSKPSRLPGGRPTFAFSFALGPLVGRSRFSFPFPVPFGFAFALSLRFACGLFAGPRLCTASRGVFWGFEARRRSDKLGCYLRFIHRSYATFLRSQMQASKVDACVEARPLIRALDHYSNFAADGLPKNVGLTTALQSGHTGRIDFFRFLL